MRKIKQILINEKNKDDGLLLEREILRKKKRKNTESKNRNKNMKDRRKKRRNKASFIPSRSCRRQTYYQEIFYINFQLFIHWYIIIILLIQ